MIITLSRRTARCRSLVDGVVPQGAVSHRFNLILTILGERYNYEVPHCGAFSTPTSHHSWIQTFASGSCFQIAFKKNTVLNLRNEDISVIK